MKQLLSLLILCIGSLVYAAPPEAVLTGPDKGLAGDLIVLSWADTKGDQTKLVPPEKLAGKILINNTDRNLGFATREQGEYTFLLIAVDKETLTIVHVLKTVTITGTIITPPKDPPTNPAPLAELTKFVKQTTLALNDQPTATVLAGTIRANIDKMQSAADRQAAFAAMGLEIEKALLKRPKESRTVDWLNKWRIPVNAEINKIESTIANSADAAAVMLAVADGLELK